MPALVDSGVYEFYGRRIRSNVELGRPVPDNGRVDLDLRLRAPTGDPVGREMPPGRPLIGEEGQPFNVAITQTEDGYVLRACELADVHFTTALDEAVCYPAPGIGGEHVRDLSATILSSWLVLRGSAVFHGSSVAGVPDLPDGHAVAFLGPSFAGKSTWAALMCSAGARFVTDDALPIGTQDGRPVVEGGCPELRLRQFETVSWPAFDALPHRLTVDGRMAVLAGDPVAGPLPLL